MRGQDNASACAHADPDLQAFDALDIAARIAKQLVVRAWEADRGWCAAFVVKAPPGNADFASSISPLDLLRRLARLDSLCLRFYRRHLAPAGWLFFLAE